MVLSSALGNPFNESARFVSLPPSATTLTFKLLPLRRAARVPLSTLRSTTQPLGDKCGTGAAEARRRRRSAASHPDRNVSIDSARE